MTKQVLTLRQVVVTLCVLLTAAACVGSASAFNPSAITRQTRADIAWLKADIAHAKHILATSTDPGARMGAADSLQSDRWNLKLDEQRLATAPTCDPTISRQQAQQDAALAAAGLANASDALSKMTAQANLAEAKAELAAAC
jgi:hypothetical protein